jgi:hypothetical protein
MRPVDGLNEPELRGSIGNPGAGNRESGDLPQNDDEPKQGDESFAAAA